MSKLAIISDIHGNLEALDAVLADIQTQGVERIYCLGDVIGYGPNPRECIDRCREFDMCLLGNHDNGALFDPDGFSSGAEKAIFWTRKQLEDTSYDGAQDRWEFLASLPRTFREQDNMFVHGSPRSPLNEYVFPEDVFNQRKIERIFGFIQKHCFQGHTHVPGVFTDSFRFYSPAEVSYEYELTDKKTMGECRQCWAAPRQRSSQLLCRIRRTQNQFSPCRICDRGDTRQDFSHSRAG